MLKGLTSTLGHVTHLPVPDLPIDIPNPLAGIGITTELVTEGGGLNLPVVGDGGVGLLSGVVGMLSGMSLAGVMDFFKNLSWESVVNLIKTVAAQLREHLEVFTAKYMGPYKKFLEDNKVMLIYGAIAIGILLLPILIFIVFVFLVIGVGLVLFCLLTGLVIGVGFVVLVVVLIPILILLVLVGVIVFVVDWLIKKFQKGEDSVSPGPTADSQLPNDPNETHEKKL